MTFVGLTAEQWFTFIGVAVGVGMGLLNWYDKRFPRIRLSAMESGQVSESLNKSIDLANKRALDAEERVERLEKKVKNFEGNLSYRIIFDVKLGSNPQIEDANIRHYPERRSLIMPYEGEDRRHS